MNLPKKLGWTIGVLVLLVLGAFVAFSFLREGSPFGSAGAAAAMSSQATPVTAAVRAEGRVVTYPGGLVEVGTETGGTVVKLHVKEGDVVKKDDLLVEFDDSELKAALAEARAGVHRSNARAGFHVKETRRLETLKESGAIPQRELDRVRSERNASFGDTAVALSAVKRIEATLAKMVLRAPIDGTVIASMIEQRETRPPGAQLLTIADLSKLRVEAEVDEFDVARVAVGASAVISAEGFHETWEGIVEEVPGALVNKGLKPRDPARPVDTRVLRVKIGFKQATPLKLGQRVEVRIAFGDAPSIAPPSASSATNEPAHEAAP